MAALPSREELEQMSTEELDALADQVLGGGGMPPAEGGAPPMPEAPMPEPMPEPMLEEPPIEEVAEVEEAASPVTDGAESALAQILTETQDAGEILERLRMQGLEIRPAAGEAELEVEAESDAIEEAPEEEASAAAAVSEPVNMRDLRKKAASNALNKGA